MRWGKENFTWDHGHPMLLSPFLLSPIKDIKILLQKGRHYFLLKYFDRWDTHTFTNKHVTIITFLAPSTLNTQYML